MTSDFAVNLRVFDLVRSGLDFEFRMLPAR